MNRYRCKKCDSENLIWRGYAAWDFESQTFKIVQADEEPDFTAFCDDCNAEEKPLIEKVQENKLIGLTDDEVEEVFGFPFHYRSFYKAVEAKLKEKNGG